jgi:hypothetical protein
MEIRESSFACIIEALCLPHSFLAYSLSVHHANNRKISQATQHLLLIIDPAKNSCQTICFATVLPLERIQESRSIEQYLALGTDSAILLAEVQHES